MTANNFLNIQYLYQAITVSAALLSFTIGGVMFYLPVSGIAIIFFFISLITIHALIVIKFIYHTIMISFLVIVGYLLFIQGIVNACDAMPALTLSMLIPLPVRELVHRYACWKQKWYNQLTLRLLDNKFLAPFVKCFHLSLLYFRYYSIMFITFLEQFISLNVFAIIVSIICSRLHVAGYLIVFCLIFLRVDLAVIPMCLFYKQYPNQLLKHFPGATVIKRGMWRASLKIIEEAGTNPKVQAVGVAVAGAVAWKALDVYDTLKQEDIATLDREASERQAAADREAAERQAAADREATKQQATADREAENSRHANTLRVEIEQRELDRNAEAHQRELDRKSNEHIAALEAEAMSKENSPENPKGT
jgi:hypothetical protein